MPVVSGFSLSVSPSVCPSGPSTPVLVTVSQSKFALDSFSPVSLHLSLVDVGTGLEVPLAAGPLGCLPSPVGVCSWTVSLSNASLSGLGSHTLRLRGSVSLTGDAPSAFASSTFTVEPFYTSTLSVSRSGVATGAGAAAGAAMVARVSVALGCPSTVVPATVQILLDGSVVASAPLLGATTLDVPFTCPKGLHACRSRLLSTSLNLHETPTQWIGVSSVSLEGCSATFSVLNTGSDAPDCILFDVSRLGSLVVPTGGKVLVAGGLEVCDVSGSSLVWSPRSNVAESVRLQVQVGDECVVLDPTDATGVNAVVFSYPVVDISRVENRVRVSVTCDHLQSVACVATDSSGFVTDLGVQTATTPPFVFEFPGLSPTDWYLVRVSLVLSSSSKIHPVVEQTLFVDARLPVAMLLTPDVLDSTQSEVTFRVYDQESSPGTVVVQVTDNVPVGSLSFASTGLDTYSSSISTFGLHTFSVVCTDVNGRTSTTAFAVDRRSSSTVQQPVEMSFSMLDFEGTDAVLLDVASSSELEDLALLDTHVQVRAYCRSSGIERSLGETLSLDCVTQAGSVVVACDTTHLRVGMTLVGGALPGGAVISALTTNQATVSVPAISSGSSTLLARNTYTRTRRASATQGSLRVHSEFRFSFFDVFTELSLDGLDEDCDGKVDARYEGKDQDCDDAKDDEYTLVALVRESPTLPSKGKTSRTWVIDSTGPTTPTVLGPLDSTSSNSGGLHVQLDNTRCQPDRAHYAGIRCLVSRDVNKSTTPRYAVEYVVYFSPSQGPTLPPVQAIGRRISTEDCDDSSKVDLMEVASFFGPPSSWAGKGISSVPVTDENVRKSGSIVYLDRDMRSGLSLAIGDLDGDGLLDLQVLACDAAGNPSTQVSRSWTHDTSRPIIQNIRARVRESPTKASLGRALQFDLEFSEDVCCFAVEQVVLKFNLVSSTGALLSSHEARGVTSLNVCAQVGDPGARSISQPGVSNTLVLSYDLGPGDRGDPQFVSVTGDVFDLAGNYWINYFGRPVDWPSGSTLLGDPYVHAFDGSLYKLSARRDLDQFLLYQDDVYRVTGSIHICTEAENRQIESYLRSRCPNLVVGATRHQFFQSIQIEGPNGSREIGLDSWSGLTEVELQRATRAEVTSGLYRGQKKCLATEVDLGTARLKLLRFSNPQVRNGVEIKSPSLLAKGALMGTGHWRLDGLESKTRTSYEMFVRGGERCERAIMEYV